jgi:SLT domain-containing protein
MFIRVASSAEIAANSIRNAANQQARLNALRGQQSTGNATTRPKGAAQGAYWPGGFQAFAKGGIVTKPTLGLVGEGGEPEYIIPESKMAAASANYLNGARGGSVIPSGNAQINVTTGPVMQQGGQQYVSMADLERAMRATANGVYASLRTPAGRYATGVR